MQLIDAGQQRCGQPADHGALRGDRADQDPDFQLERADLVEGEDRVRPQLVERARVQVLLAPFFRVAVHGYYEVLPGTPEALKVPGGFDHFTDGLKYFTAERHRRAIKPGLLSPQ